MFRETVDSTYGEEASGDPAQGRLSGGGGTPLGKADGIPVYVPPAQDPSAHQAVLVTAFLTLAVFVALYVLVYVECLVRWWLWASALLIWACLVTLGYVLVYDSWRKAACVWEQVTGRGPRRPCGQDAASCCAVSGQQVPLHL